jgi:hypothetical protein
MYRPEIPTSNQLNLFLALRFVIDAAYRFKSKGHDTLYIYLIYGRLHFNHRLLCVPPSFFVHAFSVRDILLGLNIKQRRELYRSLVSSNYMVLN